jgi:transcriptional regulator GlxA family with amidase domain
MEQAKAEPTLAYFRRVASTTKLASVCTGAMILAASGVLDGLHATTKRSVIPPETRPLDVLAKRYENITAVEASLVDTGSVITGGGVSLCIDATLHLIAKHLGDDVAQETARIIEYDCAWRANRASFPPYLEQIVQN